MARSRLEAEKLVSFLAVPHTVKEVAAALGVSAATAKKYVTDLGKTGVVSKRGVQTTGDRGRPADLFVATTATATTPTVAVTTSVASTDVVTQPGVTGDVNSPPPPQA